MNTKQLADIVLDSVKMSRACIDGNVADGGRSRDYLEHIAGFYAGSAGGQLHLDAVQGYLVDMHSVDVRGVMCDRARTLLNYWRYGFAAGSVCLLAAAPIYPALGIVAALCAVASIGFSQLLNGRKKEIAGIESGLAEDVEQPERALAAELKSIQSAELGAMLTEYRPSLEPYLLKQST